MITKRQLLGSAALAASAAIPGLSPAKAAALAWPDIHEAKAIAEEGFIFGLPIVMNYAVMYEYAVDRNSGQFKAPFNQIHNEPRVFTYKDTAIVTPNSDTPYSLLWLDLRAEPIVLSVPAVEKGRYYAVQLIDGNTFNYGYIGSRATGNKAADYMVVGPDWKGETPPGIKKVFQSGTQFSLAAYRTQLLNPGDMENVIKIQDGYKAQTLSAYLKQPAPPASSAVSFPKINKKLLKANFFEYLDFALQFAPPSPDEKERRQARPDRRRPRQDFELQGPAGWPQAGNQPRHEGRRREDRQGGRRFRQGHQRLRWVLQPATAPFSTAIGYCAPPPRRLEFMATVLWKRCIPSPGSTSTARRSMAASPSTLSPFPSASFRP